MKKIIYSLSIILCFVTALCEGVFLYQFTKDDGNTSSTSYTDFWNIDNYDTRIELPQYISEIFSYLSGIDYTQIAELSFNPYDILAFGDYPPASVSWGSSSANLRYYESAMGLVAHIVPTSINIDSIREASQNGGILPACFVMPKDTSNMFNGFTRLRVLDMTGVFVTTAPTDTTNMFSGCDNLSLFKAPMATEDVGNGYYEGSEYRSDCFYTNQLGANDGLCEEYYIFDEENPSPTTFPTESQLGGYSNYFDQRRIDITEVNQIFFNRSDIIDAYSMELVSNGDFGGIDVYASTGNQNFTILNVFGEEIFTLPEDEQYGTGTQLCFMGSEISFGGTYSFSEFTRLKFIDLSGAFAWGEGSADSVGQLLSTIPLATQDNSAFSGFVLPRYIPDSNSTYFAGYSAYAPISGSSYAWLAMGIHNSQTVNGSYNPGGGGGGGGGGGTVETTVKVTLNKDGGTGGLDNVWYKYGGSNTYYSNSTCSTTITSVSVPAKTNYLFGGYKGTDDTIYIDSNGNFINSLYTSFSSDTTLTAVWVTKKIVKVTLDSGNSEASGGITAFWFYYQQNTYYSNSSCTSVISNSQITTPTHSKYSFAGYYSAAQKYYVSPIGIIQDSMCMVDSDITLTGVWRTIQVEITLKIYSSTKSAPNTFTESVKGLSSVNVNYYSSLTTIDSITQENVAQTNASTLYHHTKGYVFGFSGVTAKSGYTYLGFTTTATVPQSSYAPSSSFGALGNSKITYYLWFKVASNNVLKYDENEGYYFEDGKTLQSYVGTTLNSELNKNIDPTTHATGKSIAFYQNGAKKTVALYSYNGQIYGGIAASKNMTLKLDGTSYTFIKGTTYWFKYEPIRWKVIYYSGTPKGWTFYGDYQTNFNVVSSRIVLASQITTGAYDMGLGKRWDSSPLCSKSSSYYSMDEAILADSFSYMKTKLSSYQGFNSSAGGSSDYTSTSYNFNLRVVSSTEIQENDSLTSNSQGLGHVKPTDYVAFLLGCSSDQYCGYYTRDVGKKLYNMTAVGVDGRLHDVYSNQFMGMRLAMTFTEGSKLS